MNCVSLISELAALLQRDPSQCDVVYTPDSSGPAATPHAMSIFITVSGYGTDITVSQRSQCFSTLAEAKKDVARAAIVELLAVCPLLSLATDAADGDFAAALRVGKLRALRDACDALVDGTDPDLDDVLNSLSAMCGRRISAGKKADSLPASLRSKLTAWVIKAKSCI